MVLLSLGKHVEELIPFGMAGGGYDVVVEGDAEIESPALKHNCYTWTRHAKIERLLFTLPEACHCAHHI